MLLYNRLVAYFDILPLGLELLLSGIYVGRASYVTMLSTGVECAHACPRPHLKTAMQFYKRLKTRGWDRRTLEPIFTAAHKQLQSRPE